MSRFSGIRKLTFLHYWLPLLLYIGMIFFLSSLPLGAMMEEVELPDKLIHAVEYSVLPILFFRFLLFAAPRRTFSKYYFWLGIMFAAVVAIGDELYQSHVPTRTMDFYDFLADLTGIGLTALGWFIWRQWRRQN